MLLPANPAHAHQQISDGHLFRTQADGLFQDWLLGVFMFEHEHERDRHLRHEFVKARGRHCELHAQIIARVRHQLALVTLRPRVNPHAQVLDAHAVQNVPPQPVRHFLGRQNPEGRRQHDRVALEQEQFVTPRGQPAARVGAQGIATFAYWFRPGPAWRWRSSSRTTPPSARRTCTRSRQRSFGASSSNP